MVPPYAKLKGTNMIERSYEPNFSLRLARKDADLIAAGHGDDDFSAVVEAGRT